MATSLSPSLSHTYDLSSDTTWSALYPSLRSLATRLVYSFRVPSWHGQEDDVIEDIVQETARRLIERSEKAKRGEAAAIHSLEQMMQTIARNYCRDLRRRDRWLVRPIQDDLLCANYVAMDDQPALVEAAIENVDRESLFVQLAHEISKFPDKQRRALLIDLANRMLFDTLPTALQEAFLEEGIQLQEYQQPLPDSQIERARHSSLLYHAYRRVVSLPCMQEYISAV
jgi:DNA-directed RNA polymerase specialized sigma24 family protein